jgi:hypothetical protein
LSKATTEALSKSINAGLKTTMQAIQNNQEDLKYFVTTMTHGVGAVSQEEIKYFVTTMTRGLGAKLRSMESVQSAMATRVGNFFQAPLR